MTGEHCDVCGWCAAPGACVWSVTCPRCEAAPGQQCRTPGTTRLEGLHVERWQDAGIDFRTWGVEDVLPEEGVLMADARLICVEDWDDLRRVEEFLAEAPSGVDFRVVDSLTEMQRRITKEVGA